MSSTNGHTCNSNAQEIEVVVKKGSTTKTRIYKCSICGKSQSREPF